MKFIAWFAALAAFATVVNFASSGPASFKSIPTTSINIWPEGKVPYEIAKQFGDSNSFLIKESMEELMKTTCVKFTPRFNNEAEYVVFVKYKHSTQENGTCWSGKWIDGKDNTVGNKKGRHFFSLWPDLACFNKFDIIRGLINISGVQTKSTINDGNNNKNKKQIFYEADNIDATSLAAIAPNCLAEASAGTCKTDQIYMSAICDKSLCDVAEQKPSTAHLRNALGRFLAVYGNSEGNGFGLIPWDYVAEKGQLWSWNEETLGSKERHICNGHGKCAASPENKQSGTRLIQWEHLDESGQKYHFLDSPRAGFYNIKNEFGNCLGLDASGYTIIVDSCNSTDNGQHWQWYKM